ncbi:MAG TPA: ABC transporter ATP-binding protein [Thermoanaerobaculia bacterium]
MIEMTHVSKTYARDDGVIVKALDDLSIRVERGEFLAVRGPSGSGKSTLLHILGCLDRPSAGAYRFLGEDVSGMSDRDLSRLRAQQIGFVFQSFHLLPMTTALENVEVPMVYASGRVDRRKAMALLDRVGLKDRADHYGPELSGGQQQRVAIARALINDPAVILADEPTGNLDAAAGAEVLELLQELHREGRTILVVTHDEDVAARALRQIDLKDGSISSDRTRNAPLSSSPAVEIHPC